MDRPEPRPEAKERRKQRRETRAEPDETIVARKELDRHSFIAPNRVDPNGKALQVDVILSITPEGAVLTLEGRTCNLEGKTPGEYRLTPLPNKRSLRR